MSKALKNSEHYIQLLAKCGLKRKICFNILKVYIPLSENNFRKLKMNSKTIMMLANSKIPFRVKKRVVSQKGGFPGTVASLAITLLSKLLLK